MINNDSFLDLFMYITKYGIHIKKKYSKNWDQFCTYYTVKYNQMY